jgi:hypothetical protein
LQGTWTLLRRTERAGLARLASERSTFLGERSWSVVLIRDRRPVFDRPEVIITFAGQKFDDMRRHFRAENLPGSAFEKPRAEISKGVPRQVAGLDGLHPRSRSAA